MNTRELYEWQSVWDRVLDSIGMDIHQLYHTGQAIEERRNLHPYPHELCFCLPHDIPYEKAGLILRLLASSRYSDGDAFLNYGGKDRNRDILSVACLLNAATPVLWSYDLLTIATTGADAFDMMPFDPSAFNPPIQLWIPDRDMILKPHEAEAIGLDPSKEWNGAGMLHVVPEAARLPVNVDGFADPKLMSYQIFQTIDKRDIVGGAKYLLHIMGDHVNSGYFSQVVAAAEFMRQPVAEVVRGGPGRPERRRAERERRSAGQPYLHVKLRRREDARTECGGKVNWSRRWIVRSHWRRQFYPSKSEHRPKLIYSYIKGPDDAPLVVAREKVVEVRR